MRQVFLSYSNKDLPFVRRLVADLATRLPGVDVFYDKLIEPGASWADTLVAQIEKADVILALLSPDYLTSPWAQQELNFALDRQLKGQVRFIPLLVRPCSPTGFLSELTWVDFTENYELAIAQLMWGITGERPQIATGDLPGVPSVPVDPKEVESLRREVKAAIELFKSKSPTGPETRTTLEAAQPRAHGQRRCFVVMPFGDADLEVVYEDFVKPVLVGRCGLQCERGDDVFGSNVVMDDILKSISAADVVLADLTRKNANVFYEVGICHALGKPVLLLAQSIEDVPFDLRHRRVLLYDYSPRGCKRLESVLEGNLNAVIQAS